PPKGAEGPVFDYVASGLPDIANLLIEFNQVNETLQTDQSQAQLNKLERLSTKIEAADAWRFESRIQTVLSQLELTG
ncbi:ABC transporter ATP-binding protein, partial [Pseudoalteromonas ruthenica]